MSKKKMEEKVLGPDDMFYPGDGVEIMRLAKIKYNKRERNKFLR
jgi:hypothetical protein